jgi:Diguanylate cyclase, GGDEF domain
VFTTFVVFEVPGLGIAHLFYLPVAALALTGGVRRGILAGAIAVTLFTLGVIINPNISPSELLTLSTPLGFLTYATMGGLLGWFSSRDRELVERLRVLAERDFLTGLPNTRVFEAAIARRLEAGTPFALLLGDMDGLKAINDSLGHAEGNDALRASRSCSGARYAPRTRLPGSAATSSPSSRCSHATTRRRRSREAGGRNGVPGEPDHVRLGGLPRGRREPTLPTAQLTSGSTRGSSCAASCRTEPVHRRSLKAPCLVVAAADGFAQVATLELEPAIPARGRELLGEDEHGAGDRHPGHGDEQESERYVPGQHVFRIGRKRPAP